jgi:hypothetical protein
VCSLVFVISVKFLMTSRPGRRGGKAAAAGLMFLLWLGIFALTASPQLHRLLHQDADDVGHHCLITQIQQHPLVAGFVPVVAPAAPPVDTALVFRAEVISLPTIDCRLSPSRAPPSGIGATTVAG